MRVGEWKKIGVHTKEYNECTEEELSRIRYKELSPSRLADVLREIDLVMEGEV